jgi:RND family efflux transporter MFP subunit
MATFETLETERKHHVRAVFSFLLVLALIGGSIGVAVLLFLTGPKAEESDEARPVPVVRTLDIELGSHQATILTQGSIESRRETRLAAELAGRVVEISPDFKRGGSVREGERLIAIDPSDFRAALARAEAGLSEANLELAQEMARVEQARIDWDRLGRGTAANPLALREPQLAAIQAQAASAAAEVERAARDLERTEIRAPFDAAIRQANAEVGAVTRPGEMLAELFSSEDLEIRLPLPLEDFGFLARNDDGSPTGQISLIGTIGGKEHRWPGKPVRLDREIDRRTLSGHLIVQVLPSADPVHRLPPVGLFVRATVTGRTLENVAVVPREAVREGAEALIVDDDSRIRFRRLTILRTTRRDVIIGEGLATGDRLCLTRLNSPVAGMEVLIEKAATESD